MIACVLAFDDGPDAGLGHRRRCEALAAGLSELGVATSLTASEDVPAAAVVVVDSYRHAADDHRRFPARRRAAIDDLDRPLAVDLLVDPNPGRTARDVAAKVLVGPAYALLDPRLAALAEHRGRQRVGGARVLVSMGGSDRQGLGIRIAGELAVGATVTLVRGPWAQLPDPGVPFAVVDAPDGLAEQLAAADVVVTAAGVTMLESMALAKPTVAVVVADNQSRQATAASKCGAAVLSSVDGVAERVLELLRDGTARERLSDAARAYVDVDGARRVAREVAALV